MSKTFTLSGVESVLSTNYFPPIHLERGKKYGLGLVSFNTFYTVQNVKRKIFYYDNKSLAIPAGYYTFDDLINFLRDNLENDSISITPMGLKCKMLSKFDIDFRSKHSLFKEFGFKQKVYGKNIEHISEFNVDFVKTKLIKIECNLVSGSWNNNEHVHILHQFAPTGKYGTSIYEHPRNIVYLPVSVETIHNITVRIVDQDHNLIDFEKENIDIRLELKEWV